MKSAVPLLLLCASAAVGAAPVYKWTDGQGQTHFSQSPPANGAYEAVRPTAGEAAAPAADAARAASQGDATRKFLEDAEAADKARAEEKARTAQAKAESARKCRAARERIAFLDSATPRRLGVPNDDGSIARMDENEFARRRDAAQKEADANCR